LLADVKKGTPVDYRSLIFAKKDQLKLLHRALLWTCDGTHELVKEPYSQLFTIQAFIRCNGNIRLVPFVFAVMTSHTTVAYQEVFEAILNAFPPEWGPPKVKEVICDFEAAIWVALRKVFGEEFVIRGCFFHWTQAIERHIQLEGLTTGDTTSEEKYMCRLLLGLPLLPADKIVSTFNDIHKQATGKTLALCNYMNRQVYQN